MLRFPIEQLSQETINQIAAGEVIENPASVVKELVDNAIDANSSSIRIDLCHGGLTLIRVSDDGVGMDRSDLALCLNPHATSKIRSTADLEKVDSMGFRGEALASIGSIGRVSIKTAIGRLDKLPLGAQVAMEGGELSLITEVARTPGTTVEVADLFYNVPVRKAFQKSKARCLTACIKSVTKIALAYPHLKFALYADDKEIFATFPLDDAPFQDQLKESIKAALGAPFLEGLIPVEWEGEELKVSGYLGRPHLSRASRSGQFLTINHRPIFCPLISRALYDGYGTRLSSHTHPTFVLHLTLPLNWVDVNVHPQKKEVRLLNEEVIKKGMYAAALKGLEGRSPPDPMILTKAPLYLDKRPPPFMSLNPPPFMSLKEERSEREIVPATPSLFLAPTPLPIIGIFSSFLLVDGKSWNLPPKIPYLNKIEEKLLFFDLAGAEKRIFFETLLAREKSKTALQGLLNPIPLEFAPHESTQVERYIESLLTWGIALRPFGKHSYLVDALSKGIDEGQLKKLILNLVEEFDTFGEKVLKSNQGREKLALTVCRHTRSLRGEWTITKAHALIMQLLKTAAPYHTPTGKPTIGHLSHDFVKKLFRSSS